MKINGKEIDIDTLIEDNEEKFLVRRKNGFMLSDEDIKILENNGINYLEYNNLASLIFRIEEILMEDDSDKSLNELSIRLSESNYYNYVNK